MTTDQKKKPAELQTELTRVYTLVAFHFFPSVCIRFNGKGEEFILKKLDHVKRNLNV